MTNALSLDVVQQHLGYEYVANRNRAIEDLTPPTGKKLRVVKVPNTALYGYAEDKGEFTDPGDGQKKAVVSKILSDGTFTRIDFALAAATQFVRDEWEKHDIAKIEAKRDRAETRNEKATEKSKS